MENTVAMASKEREKQGELEVEITYGGEADLLEHFKKCIKNAGHKHFIPVDKFNVNHLPAGCRDEDLVELVRALADLTVRVLVKYVSENRPATVPGTNKPYPFYTIAGRNAERVGTGLVYYVDKYPDEYGCYTQCLCKDCLLATTPPKVCKCKECLESDSPTTCECHECLKSGKPKTKFAHIVMLTAVHVVYDTLEGAQTTCHLFFDKGDEPEKCATAVTLKGMFRVRSYDNRDWCEMTFVTHDMELADRLEKMYKRWETIKSKMELKYKRYLDENKQSATSAKPSPQTSALSAELVPQTTALSTDLVPQTSALSADLVPQTSALSADLVPQTSTLSADLLPQTSALSADLVPEALKKLSLLVSHPHGCSKQVSVGSYTHREVKVFDDGTESEMACYTYTTPSCPGSSGGPVYIPGRSWCGYYDTHMHSGGSSVAADKQLNFSCYGSELSEDDLGVNTELTDESDFWREYLK